MSTYVPSLDALLSDWWGSGPECYAWAANVSAAANLWWGGNPVYQVSDFLNTYPKFGTYAQAIATVAVIAPGINYQVNDVIVPIEPDSSGAQLTVTSVNGSGGITGLTVTVGGTGYQINSGIQTASVHGALPTGSGYAINDILTVIQAGASSGQVQVTAVSSSGQVLAVAVVNSGTGYQTATGLTTIGGFGSGALVDITTGCPVSGGHGAGAQINIISLVAPNLIPNLPLVVIQAYVALASASLQFAAWNDYWTVGMGLYVAHMVTMYLRSEGNSGTTAQQVAASGLEKGLIASETAGNVSLSREFLEDIMAWGAWGETTYGTQLVTFAKIIGLGPSYQW